MEGVKSKQCIEKNKKGKNSLLFPLKRYVLLANGNGVLLEGVICAVGLQSMKD